MDRIPSRTQSVRECESYIKWLLLLLLLFTVKECLTLSSGNHLIFHREEERRSEQNEWKEEEEDRQRGGKKGVTKCVPNEKRRQDEKDYSFSRRYFTDFLKSPFAAAAPPLPFSPTPPRPQTTNTVREPVSSLATASSFPHGQSFWIQWTWHESIQVSDTLWKNLMLVSVGCCDALSNVCACRLFCHLQHKISSHDIN